jgi:hypothetical protein
MNRLRFLRHAASGLRIPTLTAWKSQVCLRLTEYPNPACGTRANVLVPVNLLLWPLACADAAFRNEFSEGCDPSCAMSRAIGSNILPLSSLGLER